MTRLVEVLPDPEAVASRGAAFIANAAREAVKARGRFFVALSGGRTPKTMFGLLVEQDAPWEQTEVWQVDERVAPAGDEERSLTHLAAALPVGVELRPMPVEEDDLEAAADRYAAMLPPALDLVHLGLGDDGHTASLGPGDPVLAVQDRAVAVTERYRGRRRMTLTYPGLARARRLLWIVTGEDKAPMLRRLLAGDRSIPAGRVRSAGSLVVADRAAAGSA